MDQSRRKKEEMVALQRREFLIIWKLPFLIP
jgi:hypothetical protein